MARIERNVAYCTGKEQARIAGSFRPQGSSALVATDGEGFGYSVARTDTGLYTITLNEKVKGLVSAVGSARSADGTPVNVDFGDYNAANKTLQVRVSKPAPKAIHLPLANFQLTTGVPLAVYSAAPTPGWGHAVEAEQAGIHWGTHATPTGIECQFMWPEEISAASDATLKLHAAKIGATVGDAVTFDVEVFNHVVGATYIADADYGGTTSAMTGDATTKTVQEVSLALDSGDLPTGPCAAAMSITPTAGTLGTDDLLLLGAFIEHSNLVDLSDDVDNEIGFELVVRMGGSRA